MLHYLLNHKTVAALGKCGQVSHVRINVCLDFQPPSFENVLSDRIGLIGVAVGLAWTSVGGEVMVVEATKMPGDGQLVLTGQLGDVMKESATLALNWIRSHAKQVTSCRSSH